MLLNSYPEGIIHDFMELKKKAWIFRNSHLHRHIYVILEFKIACTKYRRNGKY